MNTLFKYYLVAWLLFAVAGAYGFWRGWDVLHGPAHATARRIDLRWASVATVVALT